MLGNTVKSILIIALLTACGGGGGSSNSLEEESEGDRSNLTDNQQDRIAPTITILGKNPISITQSSNYSDAGATAKDNVDGVISVKSTGNVNSEKVGKYIITYTAVDKAGNKATDSRVINVIQKATVADTTAPIITILGDTLITIVQNSTYTDAGATAQDNIDGLVTVKSSGAIIDTSIAKSYTITYIATDKAGNKATTTRTVIVQKEPIIWRVSSVSEFREALKSALNNGENDKIILTKGRYKISDDKLGTFTFDNNEAFNLTIESEEGLTSKDVILDGDKKNRTLRLYNKQESIFTIKRVSIINGYTLRDYGGGIYSNQPLEIYDSNISYNYSEFEGGGFSTRGRVILKNSTISHNESGEGTGGGFSAGGATSKNKTIIDNSTIENNIRGGMNFGDGIITNSLINNNSGGGFYGMSVILKNSTVSNNTLLCVDIDCYGGGFSSSGLTYVENSKILNNTSKTSAGFDSYGELVVKNSLIANNIAQEEGGGFSAFRSMILVNSILYGNKAKQGAIFYNYYGEYTPSEYADYDIKYNAYVSNNIFLKNNGEIISKGVFTNNIFVNNTVDIKLVGSSKLYNNYIDNNKIIDYQKVDDYNYQTIKKSNLQPSSVGDIYLSDDNKTLTKESPVIDKGLNPNSATYKKIINNNTIYKQMLELLKTDKVGNKRVHNGTIDMGAVEYDSSK